MDRNFFYAVAVLIGTIVGVGIFALPYAVSQVGFAIGFFYLIILAVIVAYLHLAFGEIILRTEEEHRLPGYVKIYLNDTFKNLINVSTLVGLLAVLLVYLIIGGEFLSRLIPNSFNGFYFHFLFWLMMTAFIAAGFKTFKTAEFFMTAFLAAIIVLLFFLSWPDIKIENFSGFDFSGIFLPYGITLFALSGAVAIPEIVKILKEEKQKIRPAIVWGTAASAIIYLIFIVTIIGVSGEATPKLAVDALSDILPGQIFFFAAFLGFLLVATSYLAIGFYLKETLFYDFNLSRIPATALVSFVPLLFFFFGITDFIKVIALVGSLMGGFEGVTTLLVYLKAKKNGNRRPEYSLKVNNFIIYLFIFILTVGFIAGIIFDA